MKTLLTLFKDESGVTAVEYSLFAALISIAAISAMTAMGNQLNTTFGAVAAGFSSV